MEVWISIKRASGIQYQTFLISDDSYETIREFLMAQPAIVIEEPTKTKEE